MADQQAPDVPSKLHILVVEDEMMLMMTLEDALTDAGYTYVKASRMKKAMALAKAEAIDCAILDVNLAGEDIYPVAEVLSRRNIPFVLSTGYGRDTLPAEYRERPILAKPYLPEQVSQAIVTARQTLQCVERSPH
jgi:DNA-binding response OmpR family regulator